MPKLRAWGARSSRGTGAHPCPARGCRPPDVERGGEVPNVTIEWLQGRSLDQKRKVIAGITDLLVDIADARREAVQVTFIDMSKEDWGRGGLLGIDRTDVHP
ncbi:MAG TPA: tautomerase family protein [Actinomycetota bacterium]|nr:tautomerase family protein [Actinomycetota bacterium]